MRAAGSCCWPPAGEPGRQTPLLLQEPWIQAWERASPHKHWHTLHPSATGPGNLCKFISDSPDGIQRGLSALSGLQRHALCYRTGQVQAHLAPADFPEMQQCWCPAHPSVCEIFKPSKRFSPSPGLCDWSLHDRMQAQPLLLIAGQLTHQAELVPALRLSIVQLLQEQLLLDVQIR